MSMPGPNRITPQLPAGAMKTYQILAPLSTHWRPATCAEVSCPAHEHGWVTRIDESTELGQRQAHYIRTGAGRGFSEARAADGLTEFTFPAGQQCFGSHQVRLDRQETYIVRDGDWRGNPRGTPGRMHTRPEFWVEDFAEHQQKLADRLAQG